MAPYNLYIPIQVRYGDIDAQWHVNNARYLTYMEEARFHYLMKLGLWHGNNYLEVGLIVADIHVAYLKPINLLQQVRIGTRVAQIGNKSIRFEYQVEDAEIGTVLSTAETVMVAYDYHTLSSQPVPESWRSKIAEFEGWDR